MLNTLDTVVIDTSARIASSLMLTINPYENDFIRKGNCETMMTLMKSARIARADFLSNFSPRDHDRKHDH